MVLQFLTGISKLRVAGAEVHAFNAWVGQFTLKKKALLRAATLTNWQEVFNASFPIFCSLCLFLAASWIVSESAAAGGATFTTGDFIAFNSAFTAFLSAMLGMVLSFLSMLNVVPLYERATPILYGLPEIDDSKSGPGELRGEIELSHVSFRYAPDGPLILDDLSLRVRPGEFAAIVGSSGSGKSTLLRMLLGFERPDSGAVYYDGQNLAEMDVQAVRRQVGVVLQSARLSSDDIFRNIVGNSNLTREDAWAAARMAGFDKDIEQMPMQMHTVISEGGGTLSGGQCQRLLIARALIKKPGSSMHRSGFPVRQTTREKPSPRRSSVPNRAH